MANYELLRNVFRIHELIAESRPNVPLSIPDIALALKIRIVSPLKLSEKQITSAIKFLRNLGYPVEYNGEEHRWFYNWNPHKLHPALLETFTKRYANLPKPTFAVLLMLKHGLDTLVGTPLWGEVTKFFESLLEKDLWKQTRDMSEMFSVRPRMGSSISEGVFPSVAEAVYAREQIHISVKSENASDESVHLVEPYHLTSSEGLWYLVGREVSENVLQTFPLPEITTVEKTGAHFPAPEPGLVKGYLRNAFGEHVKLGNPNSNQTI